MGSALLVFDLQIRYQTAVTHIFFYRSGSLSIAVNTMSESTRVVNTPDPFLAQFPWLIPTPAQIRSNRAQRKACKLKHMEREEKRRHRAMEVAASALGLTQTEFEAWDRASYPKWREGQSFVFRRIVASDILYSFDPGFMSLEDLSDGE
ncbi:hypothetical protein DFP72DRAFT_1082212 [Ephemerocybe angulata]|uniref:Uncharacterized protein n=1 Tax=Ephemerocybe angulata TaxID=980116 RepID=A0A8H6H895_9AGAR|nr:hypothetical protein DFP72DRAFT_1082212 [Tulosesus angulatus]